MSTSPGNLSINAPSSTGNYIRIVGHVNNYQNVNNNVVIRFNPDNFYAII